jgi:Fur family ferric uptake transcriptional regulator
MKKEPGRRNTRQRQAIVEELRKLEHHPTAAELYSLVRRRLPRVSLGTIYRNLDVLTRMGVVRRVEGGRTGARFDCNQEPHHYVRCVGCGDVGDVRAVPGMIPEQAMGLEGYEILEYRLEFIGYCPDCLDHRNREEGSSHRGEGM